MITCQVRGSGRSLGHIGDESRLDGGLSLGSRLEGPSLRSDPSAPLWSLSRSNSLIKLGVRVPSHRTVLGMKVLS